MENPRIIFMGTPEFAVPSLEKIFNEFGVEAVVTVPDKPKGRGLKLVHSPIKEMALELGIPVLQPDSLKDESFLQTIREIMPDIIVVIAFRILPKELYTIPHIASFNIHGSLLPKYRGAAPINHAIINGEKVSGLTSFVLQDKVDTGNILLQRKVDIHNDMTAGDLHDLLMWVSAELSCDTINLLLEGNYQALAQDDLLASPAPKLFKDNTRIDWNNPAESIYNFVRGLAPYPTAWTLFEGNALKISKISILESKSLRVGEYKIDKQGFLVGCQDRDISLEILQAQNKRSMSFVDFLNGYRGIDNGYFS